MQALIFAAGRGQRISSLTNNPKCLLKINNKTLIERHLSNLRALGVEQVTIVVGYKASLLINHVNSLKDKPLIDFIYNRDFLEGSIVSLYCARGLFKIDDTLISMDADVVYPCKMLKLLIDSGFPNAFLVGKKNGYDGEELVVVENENGVIEKTIRQAQVESEEFAGEWVGFSKFDKVGCEIILTQLEKNCPRDRSMGYWDVYGLSLKSLKAKSVVTQDQNWVEIDFPEDYKYAIKNIFLNNGH